MASQSAEKDLEALGREVVERDQPGEVVKAAGAWLSAELRTEGFVWLRSLGTLQPKDQGRLEQVHLQNSKWNRSGGPIEFNSILNVRDRALKLWRQEHAHQAVRPDDDWVCGHPFGVAGEGEPVDDRGAEPRVGENAGPARERLVTRDRRAVLLLPLGQHLEEELRAGGSAT